MCQTIAYRLVLSSLFLLCLAPKAHAISPQHQVAGSYGATRLYAHDSVVISPSAKITLYSQTTTAASTDTTNKTKVDSLCRSIVNTSDNDYFIPWRSALTSGTTSINEWAKFIEAVDAGVVTGVTANSCCYPRINPNKPCGVSYHLGKRTAGAMPSATPSNSDSSAEVSNYGADGDISDDTFGYNRRQTWVCTGGEWLYTRDEGGCYQNGKCNTYDALTNPTGYNGATVNAIPSSNRDTLMCNGVTPTAVNGNSFPQPDNSPSVPPYGTAGWSWKCPGQNGGTSETCHADYAGGALAGVCGYASGRTYSTTPTNPYLCYVGTPTAVTGPTANNVWTWSCAGVNGGKTTNCTAKYPTAAAASCGTYSTSGRSSGLVAFETANGLPISNYLCSVGTLSGSVSGNGTTASPWTWTCYSAENNTTASCKNTYTKPGICGASNGKSLPSAPNVSTTMCTQGRWYNKATTGMSSGSVVWSAANNEWTWACLGHNLTTGEVSNGYCSASLCPQCTGTGTETLTTTLPGRFGECGSSATLEYTRTFKRQGDSTDVPVAVSFNYGDYQSSFTSITDVDSNYCSPCYKKTTSITSGSVTLSACGESMEQTYTPSFSFRY